MGSYLPSEEFLNHTEILSLKLRKVCSYLALFSPNIRSICCLAKYYKI